MPTTDHLVRCEGGPLDGQDRPFGTGLVISNAPGWEGMGYHRTWRPKADQYDPSILNRWARGLPDVEYEVVYLWGPVR